MKKQVGILCVILTALLVFVSSMTVHIQSAAKILHLLEEEDTADTLRSQEVPAKQYEASCRYEKAGKGYSRYEYLAAFLLAGEQDEKPLERYLKLVHQFQPKRFAQAAVLEEAVWSDLRYFPIPLPFQENSLTTSFENSWMFERTYGGKRGHEGTDIMASLNERGHYPVISMTDGVVEKIGWLTKGGYRIGIRSPHGGYFYYAHLYDYARQFQEGDQVKAGEFLGFMGDSGYSEVEGTVGNFDVHLHVGIYYNDETGQEVSVNPYWVLKWLEPKRLSYRYD